MLHRIYYLHVKHCKKLVFLLSVQDQEMLANTSNIVSLSTSSRSARRSHIKRSSVHQRQISVDDNQTFISDSIYMDKLSTTYEQHNSPIIRPDTEVDRTQMKLEYSETVVEKSPKSQSPRKQCLDETQLKEPVGHSDDGTRSSQSDGKFSIGNRVPDEITPRNSENVVRSPRSQRVERRPTEQTKPATKETSSSEISFRCE